MRMVMVPVSLVACGQRDPDPSPTATGPRGPTATAGGSATAAAPAGGSATTTAEGFVIHLVDRSDSALPIAYADPAWQEFLATAPLGPVLVDDAAIEAVFADPLTLVLTVDRDPGRLNDRPFVVTLDGERIYAGSIVSVATARPRNYPVIHLDDTGVAVYVKILPQLAARADTPVTAPPALLEHFRKRGVLAAAGTRPAPQFARRRFVAAVTSTKPGDPTSQVEAACTAAACTVTISYRKPGSDPSTWDQTETHALPIAEFDVVWRLVEMLGLFGMDPTPKVVPAAARVIHPPRYRVAIEAERTGGKVYTNDRSWQTPSNYDATVQHYFHAAGELGRKHATSVPVSYFPVP